jgi:hypothetical protein
MPRDRAFHAHLDGELATKRGASATKQDGARQHGAVVWFFTHDGTVKACLPCVKIDESYAQAKIVGKFSLTGNFNLPMIIVISSADRPVRSNGMTGAADPQEATMHAVSSIPSAQSKPRVVAAIEAATDETARLRAIGHAWLQARLVQRHVLAPGIATFMRAAAWQSLCDAELIWGYPMPAPWQNWRVGAPALVASIEAAVKAHEAAA